MNEFKTLFIMQLKEKIDLSFLRSVKQTIFKVIFSVIGFVAITALCYLMLWLCQRLNLFSAFNRIPMSVVAFVFTVFFIFNLISITAGLSKTLYYSDDNKVLVTFPVSANTTFLSKLVVYYVSEIKKTFELLIPFFVAYGILSSLPVYYYLWMPVMLVLITALPVALGGLMSIPAYYVILFLRKFPIIKLILSIIIFVSLTLLSIYLIGLIPENINLLKGWAEVSSAIKKFLDGFTTYFYPFYATVFFLCGKYSNLKYSFFTEFSLIVPLVLIVSIAILVALNMITSRPLYLKLITRQFEHNIKRVKRVRLNLPHSGVVSLVLYEIKKNLRDSKAVSTSLLMLALEPIAIFLLNKIYAAIDMSNLGKQFATAFNVLILLLFTTSYNISVSSVYSREGESLILNKTKPKSAYKIILSKLGFNALVSEIILVISWAIFISFGSLTTSQNVLLLFILTFIIMTHIIWSADIDFVSPKTAIYKTSGIAGVNPNEIKSVILSFILSAAAFGIVLYLLIDARNGVWLKIFFVTFFLMIIRALLFRSKVRTLYVEMGAQS